MKRKESAFDRIGKRVRPIDREVVKLQGDIIDLEHELREKRKRLRHLENLSLKTYTDSKSKVEHGWNTETQMTICGVKVNLNTMKKAWHPESDGEMITCKKCNQILKLKNKKQ